uniref:Uncharacterized protein n=1 Tax=Arundo donax TaxID=35708 RepID=A0A0A8Y5K2_ARUDO
MIPWHYNKVHRRKVGYTKNNIGLSLGVIQRSHIFERSVASLSQHKGCKLLIFPCLFYIEASSTSWIPPSWIPDSYLCKSVSEGHSHTKAYLLPVNCNPISPHMNSFQTCDQLDWPSHLKEHQLSSHKQKELKLHRLGRRLLHQYLARNQPFPAHD